MRECLLAPPRRMPAVAGWRAPLVALLVLLAASPAAASWDGRPKIFLHIVSGVFKNPCAAFWVRSACEAGVRTNSALYPTSGRYAFLCVTTGAIDSLLELECAIDYQDGAATSNEDGLRLDVWGWFPCGPLATESNSFWRLPGGSNRLTWDPPVVGAPTIIAGIFYCGAYAADTLAVTGVSPTQPAYVRGADGTRIDLTPADLGFLVFSASGTVPGCSSCAASCAEPIPVRASTWSRVKNLIEGVR
jgi:hypothetical protein